MSGDSSDVREYTKKDLKQFDELADKLVPLARKYLEANGKADTKVVDYKSPAELKEVFDFSLPAEGSSMSELVAAVEQLLEYSVRTGHPRFMDRLFAGSEPVGYFAGFINGLLNTNAYTYSSAPVMTMIEVQMMKEFGAVFGWNRETTDGVLVPGGSYANLYVIILSYSVLHVCFDWRIVGTDPVVVWRCLLPGITRSLRPERRATRDLFLSCSPQHMHTTAVHELR